LSYTYYVDRIYYGVHLNNNNYKHNDTMAKRVWRNDMAQTQKDKLAAANVGKHLTQATKAKISRSMAKYWARLPYKPGTDGDTSTTAATTTQDTTPPAYTDPFQED